MMSDRLVEIPRADWLKLRDLYKFNWPENIVGYHTIDNYIRWIQANPNIQKLNFYSLNGDWTDGTFIIVDRYQVFINSLNSNNLRLETGIRLLDWKYGFKFSSVRAKHRPIILNVIKDFQLKIEYDSLTPMYYLSQNEAKNLHADNHTGSITLRSLNESDSETIDRLWPNRHDGSLFLVKRFINFNLSIGAYGRENDLVGWCCRLQSGALGVLQVKDDHKKCGIGTLIVKKMAIKLAEMGEDTFAFVNETNKPSRKLFEKLKFHIKDNIYWIRTYPLVPFN